MQIIQGIRNKGLIIAFAVIALSLIGFILMNAKQGSNRMFSGNNASIGKINGESVDYTDFTKRVKGEQDQQEQQYGRRINGAQVYQLRQNVWDQVVAEKLLNAEFDKMGLKFSSKELVAIIYSDNAPAALKQAFTDKTTGQYDISKVQQWWAQAKKSKGDQREEMTTKIIDPVIINALYIKYSSLIGASAYYPTWMKERTNTDTKSFSNISYVAIPYNIISDSSVKVSDQDITDYLQKNSIKYKQDGGRNISYVTFSADPNASDTAKTLAAITDLKSSFSTDTSAKSFLEKNISATDFMDAYTVKSSLRMAQKDSLTATPINKVFGPYLDNGNIVLAKILAEKQMPDSVKCRYILIATQDQNGQAVLEDSIAHHRIDSIAAAIKGGADFNQLSLQYSDDQNTKNKKEGSDYTADQFSGLSNAYGEVFAQTIFFGAVNDKKVVKSPIGYEYIEVLDQKKFEPAYKIAYMSKEIVASIETESLASTSATKLSGEARDVQALNAYVFKNGLNKVDVSAVIKANDYQLGNLQDARQLIKWAFTAKEGEVSEAFNIGNQFVVAVVNKIIPEGLPDAQTARPLVENIIRNSKKAEQITAKLGATPTLESAATAYNKTIAIAGADSTLTFGAQIINGIGEEPKLIGAAFNKDLLAKASTPIAGNNGVYVIKVNSIANKAAENTDIEAQQTIATERSLAQQKAYGWFEGLKKISTIKDERSKVF